MPVIGFLHGASPVAWTDRLEPIVAASPRGHCASPDETGVSVKFSKVPQPEGAFEFPDASRSLFDAVAGMTGLFPLVRELEARLESDVESKDVDA
jgi:hypothetical protein